MRLHTIEMWERGEASKGGDVNDAAITGAFYSK